VERRRGVEGARATALALTVAGLAAFGTPAPAQSVVEVSGGGSSLLGGYGITTSVWRDGVEGWLGLGYLDGFRAGAFVRKGFGRDTLRLGNDALAVRYPTDVFSNGYGLLVQGASWSRTGSRTSLLVFGGASSAGLSAPSFLAAKAQAAKVPAAEAPQAQPTEAASEVARLRDELAALRGEVAALRARIES